MEFTIKDVLRILLVLSCISTTQIKPADALTLAPPAAAEEEEIICSICLDSIKPKPFFQKDRLSLLSCRHRFHTECLDTANQAQLQWRPVPICPYCNQESSRVAETLAAWDYLMELDPTNPQDRKRLVSSLILNAIPKINPTQLQTLREHPLMKDDTLVAAHSFSDTVLRIKILEILDPEAITEEERQAALAEYEEVIKEARIKREQEEKKIEEKRRAIQNATLLKLMATSIVAYRVLCKISGVDYK